MAFSRRKCTKMYFAALFPLLRPCFARIAADAPPGASPVRAILEAGLEGSPLRAIDRRQWLVLHQISLHADTLQAAKLCKVILWFQRRFEGIGTGSLPWSRASIRQTLEPFRSNLSGNTVMALVNALQHNSPEMFHQQGTEPASRFMKIRSIWPFPVKGSQATDSGDSEQPQEEAGESVTPSSFVT